MEELQLIFDNARKLQGMSDVSDTELNHWISNKTQGAATDLNTLGSLVRAQRLNLTPEQVEAGNASEAVTLAEQPSLIPQPLRGAAAGLQTFGQGVTFGGGDELAGVASFLGALAPGGRSPGEAFTQGRAQANEQLDQFRQEHPVASPVLQAAGGLTSGLLLPGAAGALTTATKAGTAARGAAVGLAEGAVGGALSGDGAADRLINAGIGAGAGGLLGGLAGAGTAVLARSVDRLRKGVRNLPTKNVVGNLVRDMVDATRPQRAGAATSAAEEAGVAIQNLRGAVNTVRGSAERAGKEFTLSDVSAFKQLADEVTGAMATRGGLPASIARSSPANPLTDLASTAAVAPVQGPLAAGRGAGTMLGNMMRGLDEKAADKVLDELNRVLRSTDPKVQNAFINQVAKSQPGILRPPQGSLGVLDRLLPAAEDVRAPLGPRPVRGGDIFSPLPGLVGADTGDPETSLNPLLNLPLVSPLTGR